MDLYRLADLALFPIEVTQNQVNLQGIGIESGRLGQLLDREIQLVGYQEVQAVDVVWGFPGFTSIDPSTVTQLVPLPRLPGREANQQSDERPKEEQRLSHD